MVFFRNDEDDRRAIRRRPDGRAAGQVVPLLPLRDIVVFPPHGGARCSSGARSRSRRWKMPSPVGRELLLSPRSARPGRKSPTRATSTALGTLGTIIQLLRLPDGDREGAGRGQVRAKHRLLRARRSRTSPCTVEELDRDPRSRDCRGRGARADDPRRPSRTT